MITEGRVYDVELHGFSSRVEGGRVTYNSFTWPLPNSDVIRLKQYIEYLQEVAQALEKSKG